MYRIFFLLLIFCFQNTFSQSKRDIDLLNSTVGWYGSNLFNFNEHYGTVTFKKGYFLIENEKIMGGEFIIDMHTIKNTDGDFNEMLVWHLKNPDFFDVEKYPTAKLSIQNVHYENEEVAYVNALLTIKNISHPISFKADFTEQAGNKLMKTKFIIDRTKWKINYESKSLFDSLKEDIISDAIKYEVTLYF